jgi:tRNA pseudouridine38-40 synthase
MPRFFIELCYKGTNYAGFQIQKNANSIQAEIEKALAIFFKTPFALTGSSRTDAGVHALQNFFHVDTEVLPEPIVLEKSVYNINAILPGDIVVKHIYEVPDEMHCRFDAVQREYKYFIYQQKDPFNQDRAYYYPYTLNIQLLQQAAGLLLNFQDFSSFSKRNTQVKSFICNIAESRWEQNGDSFTYTVKANRFLRGMVRGLVGTMLRVGTGKLSIEEFIELIERKNAAKTDFSVPAQGLFLINVKYR